MYEESIMAEEGPRKPPPGTPGEILGRKYGDETEVGVVQNQRRIVNFNSNGSFITNQGPGAYPTNRPLNQMPFAGPPPQFSLNPSNVPSNNSVAQAPGVAPPLAATAGPSGLGYQNYYQPNVNIQHPVVEPMQQAPSFANFNPAAGAVGNINALSNPLAWSGMKNVRDPDIDAVLSESWNTQLVLVGWSPHRKPVMNLENDVFIRSLTEDPWRHTGNVVFFCDGKKIVRCHGILLQSILPEFYEELLHMANFQYNPCFRTPELPYIPICVTGIDQRCIEHLVSLIFRGIAVMTGKEVQQVLQVMENLRIHELVVCIAPTPGNNGNPEWQTNTAGTTAAQPTSPASIAMSSTTAVATPFGCFQQDVKPNNPMEKSEAGSRQPMTMVTHGEMDKLEPARFQTVVAHPPTTRIRTDEDETYGLLSLGPTNVIKRPPINSGSTSSASGDEADETKTVKPVDFKKFSRPRRISKRIQKTIVKPKPLDFESNKKQVTPPKGSASQSPVSDNMSFGVTPRSSGLPGDELVAKYSSADVESPVKRRRRTRAKSERNLEKKTPRRVSECRGSPSDGDDEDETDRKKRKRTVYPKEMRGKALDALNEGKQVRDVAIELNVPSKLISRWKYEAKKAECDDNVVTVTLTDAPFEPKGEVNEIVNKNSLSFDFDGANNEGIPNPYMKIKTEPLVEYYDDPDQDGSRAMFSETHPGMSMHPINLFNLEDKQCSDPPHGMERDLAD